jgi:hypothetical protein
MDLHSDLHLDYDNSAISNDFHLEFQSGWIDEDRCRSRPGRAAVDSAPKKRQDFSIEFFLFLF